MLLSSSNRKYPPFPLFSYFFRPWLCAWDVCYIIFCHLLYIHSGKTGNLFSIVLCSLWWVKIVGYVLTCRPYSFVCTLHHLIIIIVQTLSEDTELIKSLRAVCFQFTHFLCDDWENIYTVSCYHHQIGSMNYYSLFSVRLWNNGMRCMSFYILIVNTLRSWQNVRRFADDTPKRIFLNENVEFRLKFHWSLFLRPKLTIIQQWFK